MGERLSQPDACKVPDLLRTLMYTSAEDCIILPSYLRFQPQKGEIKTYLVISIGAKKRIPTEPGFFVISLDFIKPTSTEVDQTTSEVNPEAIIEKVEGPAPLLPYFRLNESRFNGDHVINTYEIDEVFEPSAMAIHQRLMIEIIELKKQKNKKEFERLSKLLRELTT